MAIDEACRRPVDRSRIMCGAARDGTPAIPLVDELVRRVRLLGAAPYVHLGATSQDVVDTALVVVMREGLLVLEEDLGLLCAACARLANAHRRTVMPGRTLLQHALPITFGLKAARWLAMCERQLTELTTRRGALTLQFGGAAGTLAALGERGLAVAEVMGRILGLPTADVPWHAERDRTASVAVSLGVLAGSMEKIASDIAWLASGDVAEVREGASGVSSAMPQKRNPVQATMGASAARLAQQHAALLMTSMAGAQERAAGEWQLEWDAFPALFRYTAGAVRCARTCLEGLVIDAERMRANLMADGGTIMAESLSMALAPHVGRPAAQELVRAVVEHARSGGRSLRHAASAEPLIVKHLNLAQVARATDPDLYLGANDTFIDRVLADHRARVARTAGASSASVVRDARREGTAPDTQHAASVRGSACEGHGGSIDVEGQEIAYLVDGPADGRPLVLMHSLGANMRLWEPQVGALGGTRRIVRFDLPGHGDSGVPRGVPAIERWATIALRVLDRVGIAQADVCGISIGGVMAMWLAANAATRIRRVVLVNTTARIGTEETWKERLDLVERRGIEAVLDGAVERALTPAHRLQFPLRAGALRALLSQASSEGYLAGCEVLRFTDVWPDVRRIRVPTLIVAGEHDVATPVSEAIALQRAIPGSRLVVLPAAHLSIVERPAEFNAAAAGFLDG